MTVYNQRKIAVEILKLFDIDPTYVKQATIKLSVDEGIEIDVTYCRSTISADIDDLTEITEHYVLVKK